MDKTPDELITERKEHQLSTDEFVRRQHEEKLTMWGRFLGEKKGLARGSIVTALNTVKSFYKANYVLLQVKSPKSWLTRERRVPSIKELNKMLQKCRNPRDEAIIITLAQSGVSLEDFINLLTYGKVKKGLNDPPIHLRMERSKIKKKYDTFLGQDSVDYIKKYVAGKRIRANRSLFNLSPRAIQYIVMKASKRAGLTPHVTPHKLRSFFSTYLKLGGCPDIQVEYWMGHTIPYGGAYFVPPVEEQRKIYKKYESSISL